MRNVSLRSRNVFLLLVVVGAIANGIFGYLIIDQNGRINERTRGAARLSKSLCIQQSQARVAANDQIRRPLRHALRTIAAILHASAKAQQDPVKKQQALSLAESFDKDADKVQIVQAFKCQVEG